MSVSRPFKWFCNICTKVTEKEGYGLPKNWEFYGGSIKEPEVKHICDGCCEIRDARLTRKEFDEFYTEYTTDEINNRHPDLRIGQHLFSLFYEAHTKVADRLSGTEANCFYTDSKIDAFWEAVKGKIKG